MARMLAEHCSALQKENDVLKRLLRSSKTETVDTNDFADSSTHKYRRFNREEMEELLRLVNQKGEGKWKDILHASKLWDLHRTSANLRDKWRNLRQSKSIEYNAESKQYVFNGTETFDGSASQKKIRRRSF